MPQLFLPNLTFEDELSGLPQPLPPLARRLVAELAPVMALLATAKSEAGDDLPDLVLMPSRCEPAGIPLPLQRVRFLEATDLETMRLDQYELTPWGWSEPSVSLGRQFLPHVESPNLAAVRHVNSREFLAPFDRSGPLASPAAQTSSGVLCRSMADVTSALKQFRDERQSRWVIKSNFSQAARNRIIGSNVHPDADQTKWLKKRFAAGEPVYAEPWLDRLAECGLQFWIPKDTTEIGPIHFFGASEMLTDPMGRYRGSIIGRQCPNAWWSEAIPHCQSIAQKAAALGFWGSIGMDCMLYRHPASGEPWLRMCHDINGRFTMGRVALSLFNHLRPGETGFWCHCSSKTEAGLQNVFETLNVKNVRIVSTSPERIGNQPTSLQTALLISDDCENLVQVTRKILSQNIRGPFQMDFGH